MVYYKTNVEVVEKIKHVDQVALIIVDKQSIKLHTGVSFGLVNIHT